MSTQLTVSTDPRAAELLSWSAETGQPLPLPIDVILAFEDDGGIIDLTAGAAFGSIYGSEQAWLDHIAALASEVTP